MGGPRSKRLGVVTLSPTPSCSRGRGAAGSGRAECQGLQG